MHAGYAYEENVVKLLIRSEIYADRSLGIGRGEGLNPLGAEGEGCYAE